jgi:hypothetical protein
MTGATENLGKAEITPKHAVEAGSIGTWTIVYRPGLYGVDDGGGIRIARRFASDWGDPQTDDPASPNYLTARSSTTAALRSRQPRPSLAEGDHRTDP